MRTPEQIKKRFPIGDRIEYETGRGHFSGVIVGHPISQYGVSLDLGDRKYGIWSEKDYELAERWHRPAQSEPEIHEYGQLKMF